MALKSRQLTDATITSIINSSRARTVFPSLFKMWDQIGQEIHTTEARVSSCKPCQKKRALAVAKKAKAGSMDRVRAFIASMPFEQKVQLKKILDTEKLVISYLTSSNKRVTVIV